jgi:hypothetical protein
LADSELALLARVQEAQLQALEVLGLGQRD